MHAADVLAPDPGAQTKLAVVGDTQRIGFVLERDHADDRAEDFFAGQGHVVGHAGVDGRFDVPAVFEAFVARDFAADGRGQAFAFGDGEVALDFLELRVGGDGA
ncbi:hypothetical protein D3C87_1131460 [compost metagenome]